MIKNAKRNAETVIILKKCRNLMRGVVRAAEAQVPGTKVEVLDVLAVLLQNTRLWY
jgi:hypothetical protein